MKNNEFDPVGLHVEPGTTVRFEIRCGSHSATAYEDRVPTKTAAFDSGVLSSGGFDYTFETPGTYDYYCIPHQSVGMVGRIVVGEPGGPAESGSVPDGSVPESQTITEQGSISLDEFGESGGDGHGAMRGSGGGMMGGDGMGWMILMPAGFISVFLGLVAGVVYGATRLGTSRSTPEKSSMATLRKRYARGELTQEEFEQRQEDRKQRK